MGEADITTRRIEARVLHAGKAQGEVLVLSEPLSFWGGFDPVTGKILDKHHPEAGVSVTGKIVVMPASRGSAGTPAGVAESIRLNTGPGAIILYRRDVNIAVGAIVACELYGHCMPVLVVSDENYGRFISGQPAQIDADGAISLSE
ncbi:aconitase X swivel domain-containing protein [Hoeflea prorocentri]|uniref:DUF126 domain-containing protein n=1 Tax=Hoeflea prorocentri TaxID=1922333 RepID=A0A9X3UJJ0_9HYPH|nr:DUF126 domain-containing protein [Hoeflea prorocentri]MCY6381746.1 DUF126 domain-containing protein [Hoeflea prorocentri]MDA5399546.1 DUF126 domain-containing protein [Hoeflea prorocentri]